MARRIVGYLSIVADNAQKLDYAVNEAIKQGWQPYGNQVVLGTNVYGNGQETLTEISQPMIKRQERIEGIMPGSRFPVATMEKGEQANG